MNKMTDSTQPIIVLSSGGKDSLFMLERLRADPDWDVAALVTTINETNDRVAMHGTPLSLLRAQADAVGLPLTAVRLPEDCGNKQYEHRLMSALAPFQDQGVKHVACGDLFLCDIRQWREALFARHGWQAVFPIWHTDTGSLADRLFADGWGITVTCVDTDIVPQSFLGRCFDRSFVDDLPEGVDPCGENGEFHTFVHDGPGFSHALPVRAGRTVLVHQRFAMMDLLPG